MTSFELFFSSPSKRGWVYDRKHLIQASIPGQFEWWGHRTKCPDKTGAFCSGWSPITFLSNDLNETGKEVAAKHLQ
jgi:hypothetical protein